jgi:hypothetical protein
MVKRACSTDRTITGREKSTQSGKRCPIVTLSIKNPSCTTLGLNLGLCSKRLATAQAMAQYGTNGLIHVISS